MLKEKGEGGTSALWQKIYVTLDCNDPLCPPYNWSDSCNRSIGGAGYDLTTGHDDTISVEVACALDILALSGDRAFNTEF
jgi:hypothetical protein